MLNWHSLKLNSSSLVFIHLSQVKVTHLLIALQIPASHTHSSCSLHPICLEVSLVTEEVGTQRREQLPPFHSAWTKWLCRAFFTLCSKSRKCSGTCWSMSLTTGFLLFFCSSYRLLKLRLQALVSLLCNCINRAGWQLHRSCCTLTGRTMNSIWWHKFVLIDMSWLLFPVGYFFFFLLGSFEQFFVLVILCFLWLESAFLLEMACVNFFESCLFIVNSGL